MHSHLRTETPDPDREVQTGQSVFDWPVAVLAFAGVLTGVWIALLLWAFVQILSWVIS